MPGHHRQDLQLQRVWLWPEQKNPKAVLRVMKRCGTVKNLQVQEMGEPWTANT